MAHGLFIGLTTLDVIYHVDGLPHPNQKIVAEDYDIAAGGPATNAAVAFQHLGQGQHDSTLLSGIGSHALGSILRSDIQTCGLTHWDLHPQRSEPPPTSSILVTQASGDRAVVSLNAARAQASSDRIPDPLWTAIDNHTIDVVLIDGHQMAVSAAIAPRAKQAKIPIVIDGGSWKPGFEKVLPWADYAICSANFQPPQGSTPEDRRRYLIDLGIPHIIVTHGDRPIQWWHGDRLQDIPVPTIQPVDTLGAGDIFHGAFCHFILTESVETALHQAAQCAAAACLHRGTRRWRSPSSID